MENSPFRKLPPELRNNIWELAVVETNPICLSAREASKAHPPSTSKQQGLALLSTCKEIRNEATGIFFALNTFLIGRDIWSAEDLTPTNSLIIKRKPSNLLLSTGYPDLVESKVPKRPGCGALCRYISSLPVTTDVKILFSAGNDRFNFTINANSKTQIENDKVAILAAMSQKMSEAKHWVDAWCLRRTSKTIDDSISCFSRGASWA